MVFLLKLKVYVKNIGTQKITSFSYKLTRLSDEFSVPKSDILKIVRRNCIAFSKGFWCHDCGEPIFFKSRQNYTELRRFLSDDDAQYECPDCYRTDDEKKAEVLENNLVHYRSNLPINIKELSFEDAIYLLSFIRLTGSDNLTFLNPYNEVRHNVGSLSPTEEWDRDIIVQLWHNRILCVHPGSDPESFDIEDDRLASCRIYDVKWAITLPVSGPSEMKFIETLNNTIENSEHWPDIWFDQHPKLHRKVALHECFQYVRLKLEEHDFFLKIGNKVELVVSNALNHFSVAQIYNLIWRAVRDAAAFYVREHTTKTHAVNTIPGAIERSVERAVAEKWEIKPYGRDYNAPQSMVSQVLYNKALKLGDEGFTIKPPEKQEDIF